MSADAEGSFNNCLGDTCGWRPKGPKKVTTVTPLDRLPPALPALVLAVARASAMDLGSVEFLFAADSTAPASTDTVSLQGLTPLFFDVNPVSTLLTPAQLPAEWTPAAGAACESAVPVDHHAAFIATAFTNASL